VPDRHTSRLLWIAFGLAIVLLAWQFQDRLETIFSGRGVLTVEDQSDRVLLRWRGQIDAPLASKLEQAFREHVDGTRRFLLSLHSPGGTLEHGREVIRLIQRMQRTRAVDTVVEDKRVCASMCVAVYLAGARRTAAPNARFMFHEVSFHDSLSDHAERAPSEAISRATDGFFEQYLKPAGLDERWLADMRAAVRGKDVWRTAAELVEQHAGVVQRLE
jgi:hypothetical protein